MISNIAAAWLNRMSHKTQNYSKIAVEFSSTVFPEVMGKSFSSKRLRLKFKFENVTNWKHLHSLMLIPLNGALV